MYWHSTHTSLKCKFFSVTCALTKVFDVTSLKESVVLKKSATILKLKERLYHGNGGSYLLAARIYISSNGSGNTDKEGNNQEEVNNANLGGTTRTTVTTTIKCKTRGEEEVK